MEKIGGLVFRKVAKTVNIGKKVQCQEVLIMLDTSACRRLKFPMQKITVTTALHW